MIWVTFLPFLMPCVAANRTSDLVPFFHGHVFENSSPGSRVNGLSVPLKRLNSRRLCGTAQPCSAAAHYKLLGDGSEDFRVFAHHKRGHVLLKTTQTLDREERAEYALSLGLCCGQCAEGEDASELVASIKVDVLDTNDHQPVFPSANMQLDLDDATALRAAICSLSARDGDSGKNAELIYFTEPKNGSFYAVPKTGDILLVDSILGLEEPIKFQVFARDRGWPPRTSQGVSVEINPRQWPAARSATPGPRQQVEAQARKSRSVTEEETPVLISVSEDAGIGSVVVNLNPVRFQSAAFELVEPELESSPVSVNRDGGDVVIMRKLDRETEPLVEITVRVQDKRGQYEQPAAAAPVQRRKEPVDRLRESEGSPGSQGYAAASHPEEGQRPRMTPASIAAKHGEEVSPAASDLAMVLTRGLSVEQQKSSRDSLQYSSGYSTETTTPSCSEDTIPSQGSDYDCYSVNGDTEGPDGQAEFDKSSTIPRHSNIAQNYRRMIQTKRPASTAGLPSGVLGPGVHGIPGQPGGAGGGGGSGTPGTATIRRTPSTKPGVRRTLSSAGPIPIRPPIVPVKTPTVPADSHSPGASGYAGGGQAGSVPVRVGSEECVFFTGAEDGQGGLDYVKASPKRLSLPNTAWGSGAALEVYAQQHYMASGSAAGSEEEQMIAANRHSLVEKIGELVASAHALGEGQFPFPALPDDPTPTPGGPSETQTEGAEGSGDMLTTIRRGVRLRKTVSNDRSAPRIL